MADRDDSTIQYWAELSDYDYEVARSMHTAGHYLYVGFMCHQSVEKILKAIYVKKRNTTPPYIHKLDKLIEFTSLNDEFSERYYEIIDELSPLNIQARYPAHKDMVYKQLNTDKSKDILTKTGELLVWLKQKLK
jgi:HEPN domain-containing protein